MLRTEILNDEFHQAFRGRPDAPLLLPKATKLETNPQRWRNVPKGQGFFINSMPSKLYSLEAKQILLGDPYEPKALTEKHAQAEQAAKGCFCRKGS